MKNLPPDPFDPVEVDAIILDEESTETTGFMAAYLDDESSIGQREVMAGESFSSWLADQLPDIYGGDKTLDAVAAYELLQTLQSDRY